MMQQLRLLVLGLTLIVAGLACAPKLVGPTTPSGYFFFIRSVPPTVSPGAVFDVVVAVQDAQGRSVDGVSVAFQVEPSGARGAPVTPAQATLITRKGRARARFQAHYRGSARVVARVEQSAQSVDIVVEPEMRGGEPGGGDV